MPNILVTGGAGMIGSNLVKALIFEGHDVWVIDNLWRGNLDNLKDDFGGYVIDIEKRFLNADLTIPNVCDELISEMEYVIHLADIVAGINYVFSHEAELFRANIQINSNVINSARIFGKKLNGFIYAGTACSFPLTRQNSLDVIPLVETELFPAMPESAYGWSKLIGQYETELLEKETGIPTCSLMFHNAYGSPCDYGERSQVIPALIRKAIEAPAKPFIVWGNGLQGRAFVHVDDIVKAIILGLKYGLGNGPIQIGPSVCTSIKEIAELIVLISGKKIEIKFDSSKPSGDMARSADYSKAKSLLGWEPSISLEEGLRKQYEWIEKQLRTI